MKIIHLMRTYGVHGGEWQLAQLFAKNTRSDIEENFVFVFEDKACSNLFKSFSPNLKQVKLYPKMIPTGTVWWEFFLLLPYLPLLQWRFFKLIKKLRPNVCMVHGFQAALIAWPTIFFYQKSFNSAYMHRTTKKERSINFFFYVLYYPFELICGNSSAVASSLSRYISGKKLMILQNGIDINRFDEHSLSYFEPLPVSESDIILISVGRLLPSKRQDVLISAIDLLLPIYPNLKLLIVGSGDFQKNLSAQVAKLGIQKNIIFLGQRTDVPVLLKQATIFLNASLWEGMSNAVLEAMAASLPSIVCDAPGVSECHLHDKTGLIVNHNPQAIAQAITQLLENSERANAMGQAARNHVEVHYSIQASRQRYDNLYEKLTEV